MDKIWSEFKWLIGAIIAILIIALIAVIVLKCTGVIGKDGKVAMFQTSSQPELPQASVKNAA
jgi:hypothetical protein